VLLGPAPVLRRVPAGLHRLRVEWRSGESHEENVQVPARSAIQVEMAP
jgi:hypothetical protein